MACLSEEIKETANKSDLWMLSSVYDDGSPRTIPVAFKKILSDDEVMLVNNYMNATLNNIKARPDKVSLTVWADGVVFHVSGKASIYNSGRIFQQGVEIVKSKRPNLDPKSVVMLKVTSTQTWHRPR